MVPHSQAHTITMYNTVGRKGGVVSWAGYWEDYASQVNLFTSLPHRCDRVWCGDSLCASLVCVTLALWTPSEGEQRALPPFPSPLLLTTTNAFSLPLLPLPPPLSAHVNPRSMRPVSVVVRTRLPPASSQQLPPAATGHMAYRSQSCQPPANPFHNSPLLHLPLINVGLEDT